ncbi:MAG: hypothetical protein PHF87_05245 [Desulfotomaculaceae bacterium]|nr:hypothetical protein [Desulfotomaculaceae bacterium]
MKVLLIYLLTGQKNSPGPTWASLGLSFIDALLERAGHTVSIFDRFAAQTLVGTEKDRVDAAMLKHIKDFGPDLIGFNTVSPQNIQPHSGCQRQKGFWHNIKIGVGGNRRYRVRGRKIKIIHGRKGDISGLLLLPQSSFFQEIPCRHLFLFHIDALPVKR